MYDDPLSQKKFGLSSILREKYSIPKWLPINAEIQHGWYPSNTFFQNPKISKNKRQLVWSDRMMNACRKSGIKHYYCIGSPFVHYRQKYNIEKKNDAKGTVVFPQHSSEGWNVEVDWIEFITKLKKLEEEFQPITICLYHLDYINVDVRSQFANHFKVVTAGNIYSADFVKNFYRILSSHKYATSNTISTFSVYSTEMGVPFFLTAQEFSYTHKFDSTKIGTGYKEWKASADSEFSNAHKIFPDYPIKNISPAQIEYVDRELGIRSESSRHILWLVLFFSGLKVLIKLSLKELITYFKK